MKIEIKNFGPIDYLQFDLDKDLHLIYGKNAIGKSYATYCIYCLLKNIKTRPEYRHFFYQEDTIFRNPFISLLKNLKGKNENIKELIIKLVEDQLKSILLKNLENSLLNTFSSLKNLKNRFTKKNYEISILLSDSEKIIFFSNDEGILDLKYETSYHNYEIVIKNTKSTKYSLYLRGKVVFKEPTEAKFINILSRVAIGTLYNVLNNIELNIKDIYYLPASRSGLYQALNAFTPIIAELTQNRFFMQNKNIELPSLSEPLADYFIDLSTVDKKNINENFKDIIETLQKDILKGEVEYNDKTKRIVYKPDDIDLELNLSEASSMVAELSPLVLYFKHIINNKFSSFRNRDYSYEIPFYDTDNRKRNLKGYDILFIEEPEAHLHPEVQVKLLEVFSKLSSLNLKIVITSHSNYMFNKLNNLLISDTISSNNTIVYHLIKGESGTLQNKNMLVTEDGINDDNFADTAEELYYERMQSLEAQDDK